MPRVEIRPVTADRWGDVLGLFGDNGAYANCWCMWWRTTSAEFSAGLKGGNRRAFQRIVREDRVPGIIAYVGGEPAGWCSVAPRSEFGRLDRSPALKPVDDTPVWSIVCLYIDRSFRKQGVGAALLRGAVAHARRNGARVVEGYPVDDHPRPDPASAFTGVASMFRDAGFREVAHRPGRRSVMRRELRPNARRG